MGLSFNRLATTLAFLFVAVCILDYKPNVTGHSARKILSKAFSFMTAFIKPLLWSRITRSELTLADGMGRNAIQKQGNCIGVLFPVRIA